MLQTMMLQRCLLRAAVATLACFCAGLAAAQSIDAPANAPSEDVFDGPVDFSLPPPTSHPIDASKFAAAPSKGWDGQVSADSGDRTSGAAWATLTAPTPEWVWDKASVATRVDPAQQGSLGVMLSRSLPFSDNTVSMTWQGGYAVSQALGPGAAAAAGAPQAVSTDQAVRFTIVPADTTLSVGAAISSADDKWTRSFSAEQKLFGGPISVTGAVSEHAAGDISKSLKAAFKRTW
jgi:hypothetical protein